MEAKLEIEKLKYESDKAHRHFMYQVLVLSIGSAAVVMLISVALTAGYSYSLVHTSNITSSAIIVPAGIADASKNVLPFATGLIGFAGGVVTSLFQRSNSSS